MNDSCSEKYRDCGLLVLRVGMGVIFMLHGYPKMFGGAEMWVKVGSAMGLLGITFAPAFWGFMASFAEFGGGLLLALGLFTRMSAVLLLITMLLATYVHLHGGDDFGKVSHPAKCAVVFLALVLLGPGRYALDACRKCCGGAAAGDISSGDK